MGFSNRQLQMFERYYELLLDWNSRFNLTRIIDAEAVAIKHIIDSLLCHDLEVFQDKCRVADIGSGAGFPGIPLKIYRDDISMVLIESLRKRTTFLQAVIDDLCLTGTFAFHLRAEEAHRRKEMVRSFDVVTARAVAPLPKLLEYCIPLVKPQGYFVALKGPKGGDEITSASTALLQMGASVEFIKQFQLPIDKEDRMVIYIKKHGK